MSRQSTAVNTKELEELMQEFPDWKEEFPEIFKEVCPQRFHKNVKNHVPNKDRVIQKRSTTVSKSDYQATYGPKRSRPRSTKRPPASPRDPNPPPMKFNTVQRDEFIPKDVSVKAEPVKMEENYEKPQGKMNTKSSYQHDYPVKFSLPEIPRPQVARENLQKSDIKFDSRTTAKEHFKQWVPQPNMGFKELPCFSGTIIYPEKGHHLETTNQFTFKGSYAPKQDPVRMSDGNIKIEGKHDLDTTNKLTYTSFEGAQPAQKVTNKPQIVVTKRSKLSNETQTQHDFAGFKGRQPSRTHPVAPAPETIQLKFNDRQVFETEQRKQFPGCDVSKFPAPKIIKKDEEYKPPTAKFDAISHLKHDYPPQDVSAAFVSPVHMQQPSRSANLPKFSDATTYKDLHQKWRVEPRVRYGDPMIENYKYVPPKDRFEAKSTTHDTFVGKSGEVPLSFKPEEKPIATNGQIDLNTVYRKEFLEPQLSQMIPKAQAKVLLKELRQRKKDKGCIDMKNQHPVVAN